MEELIRWIIIIVVIYSFLKGIFSKKNPETKEPSSTGEIPDNETFSSGTTVPKTEKRRAELTLEDILRRIPVEKPTENKVPEKKENPNTFPDYEKYSENRTFDSPVDYDLGITRSKESINKAKSKEKSEDNKKKKRELSQQSLLLKAEEMQTTKESEIVISLKKKLKQPESLREMFIMSEILGKPKALRKW